MTRVRQAREWWLLPDGVTLKGRKTSGERNPKQADATGQGDAEARVAWPHGKMVSGRGPGLDSGAGLKSVGGWSRLLRRPCLQGV